MLLKGKEIDLPHGAFFTDKEAVKRSKIRVKWWLDPRGHSYHSLSFPSSDTVPHDAVAQATTRQLGTGYPTEAAPVFIGHYWLPYETLSPVAQNIACLDFSVAKGGPLAAYRWDGEQCLSADKFVIASSQSMCRPSG